MAGVLASATPAANKVPIADGSGKLDPGWLDPGGTDDEILTLVAGAASWAPNTRLESVVAGTNVTVDNTDPLNPIVSASGGGGGGGDIDWASPVSITGTTTVTSSGVGKLHICTGTSADYTVTLPDSGMSAGAIMAFQMGNAAALTRLVTLDATSGNLIDGVQTRIMWANEVCILKWDGTNWTKVGGKSIPMVCCMQRASATAAQSVTNFVWTQIACTTTVSDNTSALAVPLGNTTNGRAEVLRPGKYIATGFASLTGLAAAIETNGGVARGTTFPGDNPNAFTTVPVPSSGNVAWTGSGIFDCAAGDWLAPVVFHGDSGARNTRTVATVLPSLSVAEIISW